MLEKNLIPKLRFQGFDGEWREIYLEKITDKIQDGTHFSPETSIIGDFKYITSKNIKFGGMDLTNVEYITKESHEKIYQRCDVKFNDILLTKDGASTGNVCLNELSEEFSLLSSVAFIRGNKKKTINEFLFQAFLTPNGQEEILRSVAGQAITRITLTKIRKFKFVIPQTLPEQQKIASFLTAVDQRIQLLKRKKIKQEEYKKGVMQKLFSQEIRFTDENGSNFPDWEEKRLWEVCEKKSSNLSANTLPKDVGHFKVYGASGLLQYVNFYTEEEPYISIVKDGAGVGRILLCESKSSVLGTLDLLKPKHHTDLYFLYSILSNINFWRYKTGSTIPHIYYKDYSKEKIEIPKPQEQKKISTFLSNLDQKIEKVGVQIEKMQAWKKGLLQKMFV